MIPAVWNYSPQCVVCSSLVNKHKTERLDKTSHLANKYTQLSEMVCDMMVLLLSRQGKQVWTRSKAHCVDVCVNMSV